MANERLRSTLLASGTSVAEVAARIAVDPKTVERWISLDRLPHRGHRRAAAEVLGCEETYLWPALLTDQRSISVSQAELVEIFPSRGAVPPDLWPSLARSSREEVDILAFSALFLPDYYPDLSAQLAAQAKAGLRVRIALGDPGSNAVHQRGSEETIDDGLVGRVKAHLAYLKPLLVRTASRCACMARPCTTRCTASTRRCW